MRVRVEFSAFGNLASEYQQPGPWLLLYIPILRVTLSDWTPVAPSALHSLFPETFHKQAALPPHTLLVCAACCMTSTNLRAREVSHPPIVFIVTRIASVFCLTCCWSQSALGYPHPLAHSRVLWAYTLTKHRGGASGRLLRAAGRCVILRYSCKYVDLAASVEAGLGHRALWGAGA